MAAASPISPSGPRCAVVVHDRDDRAEDLLAAFVARLAARPLRVGGVYQVTEPRGDAKAAMAVIDIATGARIPISQDLGKGSDSCTLDPAGLAEASVVLRRAIEDRVDLLIASKFSSREIEGQGLAAEIFDAIAEGIPVLTLVSERNLEGWETLSGGLGDRLPPRLDALEAWVDDLQADAALHQEEQE